MECRGRRGRRGRNPACQQFMPFAGQNFTPCQSKSWSCLNGLYSFFIMASLIGIIYMMLEYHCTTCSTKCDINNITKHIEDISKNLSHIKMSYKDLEIQVSKFSQDLPRLEGQIEVLEALANTMESKDFAWNPKTHLTLPNVDVYLSKMANGKNISRLSSKRFPDTLAV